MSEEGRAIQSTIEAEKGKAANDSQRLEQLETLEAQLAVAAKFWDVDEFSEIREQLDVLSNGQGAAELRSTTDDQALIEWAKKNEGESRCNRNNKQITDAGARALAASCFFLIEIQLSNTQVTDVGVKGLARSCSNLTRVNLNDCTQVTDTGVQALSRCEHLEKIELRNTQVTDTGVQKLADRCNKLKHIDLNGTRVTRYAMQYMRRALPRLTFERPELS